MTRNLILIAVDRATGEVIEGGKPSGFQIVPKEPSEEILIGMIEATALATGSTLEMHRRYNGMLSASRVDLTKAEVNLPERWVNHGSRLEDMTHNEVIDAITEQMKWE